MRLFADKDFCLLWINKKNYFPTSVRSMVGTIVKSIALSIDFLYFIFLGGWEKLSYIGDKTIFFHKIRRKRRKVTFEGTTLFSYEEKPQSHRCFYTMFLYYICNFVAHLIRHDTSSSHQSIALKTRNSEILAYFHPKSMYRTKFGVPQPPGWSFQILYFQRENELLQIIAI